MKSVANQINHGSTRGWARMVLTIYQNQVRKLDFDEVAGNYHGFFSYSFFFFNRLLCPVRTRQSQRESGCGFLFPSLCTFAPWHHVGCLFSSSLPPDSDFGRPARRHVPAEAGRVARVPRRCGQQGHGGYHAARQTGGGVEEEFEKGGFEATAAIVEGMVTSVVSMVISMR